MDKEERHIILMEEKIRIAKLKVRASWVRETLRQIERKKYEQIFLH